MTMCDRCRVPGCLLTYMGEACRNARKMHCPDVRMNRAELIDYLDIDGKAPYFIRILLELCEDGCPSIEQVKEFLAEDIEE